VKQREMGFSGSGGTPAEWILEVAEFTGKNVLEKCRFDETGAACCFLWGANTRICPVICGHGDSGSGGRRELNAWSQRA